MACGLQPQGERLKATAEEMLLRYVISLFFKTYLLTDHRILAHYPHVVPSPTGALQNPHPTGETGGNEEVTAETDLNTTSLVESKE